MTIDILREEKYLEDIIFIWKIKIISKKKKKENREIINIYIF